MAEIPGLQSPTIANSAKMLQEKSVLRGLIVAT